MEIDELSEEIIRQFFCRYNPHPEQVDIELFVTDYLKIPLVYETFAEEEQDRLGFTSNGKRPLKVVRGTEQQRNVRFLGEKSARFNTRHKSSKQITTRRRNVR